MINKNELRIGNCVLFNEKKDRIYELLETMALGHNHSHYIYQRLHPIPITEDILLKCGFEYENMGDDSPYERWLYKKDKQFWIWNFNKSKEWLFCVGDSLEISWPKASLHQLQNLVHSLTGEELNIEL